MILLLIQIGNKKEEEIDLGWRDDKFNFGFEFGVNNEVFSEFVEGIWVVRFEVQG